MPAWPNIPPQSLVFWAFWGAHTVIAYRSCRKGHCRKCQGSQAGVASRSV